MENDSNRRVLRVQKEIREILSRYLISHYQSQLGVVLSVPDVRVSKDLKHAKVLVSVLNNPEKAPKVCEFLDEDHVDIQAHLGQQLKMKFCPKVRFYPDTSYQIWDKFKEIEA